MKYQGVSTALLLGQIRSAGRVGATEPTWSDYFNAAVSGFVSTLDWYATAPDRAYQAAKYYYQDMVKTLEWTVNSGVTTASSAMEEVVNRAANSLAVMGAGVGGAIENAGKGAGAAWEAFLGMKPSGFWQTGLMTGMLLLLGGGYFLTTPGGQVLVTKALPSIRWG